MSDFFSTYSKNLTIALDDVYIGIQLFLENILVSFFIFALDPINNFFLGHPVDSGSRNFTVETNCHKYLLRRI